MPPQASQCVSPGISDEKDRARALAALAPQLAGPLLEQALQAARHISPERGRADVLIALVPQLPEARRMGILEQALQATEGIDNERERMGALVALAPLLPTHLVRKAFQAAQRLGRQNVRAEMLAALTPHLPEELQKDALQSLVLDTSWENRRELLTPLQHCFFVLTRLEGRDALRQIERALSDTGRWFP